MNPDSSQQKPEESNTQIQNPNPEQNADSIKPAENQTKVENPQQENNPMINSNSMKFKESLMVLEEAKEEKKEEEKKEEEKKEEEKKEEKKKEEEKKEEEGIKVTEIKPQSNEKVPAESQNEIKPKEETQIKKENDEIEEIEEAKPQIKIDENKINFSHPMNNYATPESIKEIETCPPNQLFNVLSKRLNDIPLKLADILRNNEKYTLICLYYKIYYNFMMNQNAGNNPKLFFQRKDVNSRLKISDFDFQEVLVNELHCQLTSDEIIFVLRSLKQKTENLYSYDEFLKNVISIRQRDEEFKEIYQECSFNFDDYIYSFRHFIQDNKIDFKGAYTRSCTGITELPFDLFKKFLTEINFKLANEKEIIHLFCSLCPMNYTFAWNNLTSTPYFQLNLNTNLYLSQKILFEIAERKDISEEDFNEMGKITNKNIKNDEWTKNIMNFTEETKKLNKKQYESFRTVFKNIHKKCIEYDIKSLTKFFAESDFIIEPDGDIEIKDFRDVMNNLGVSYNIQLEALINKFKNMKKKPKEMMKLVDFLSIYNIFSEEDVNENDMDNNEIKEKDKDSISSEVKEKEKDYVYKNAHRKFTQDDIDYVVEICKGLADIIIDELNDSITNFINRKDKNNQGYITLNDFKDIMEHDLKIDYKSDIENLQIFFDFITSNKMIEGEDIIETKKLINILITYSERDKPDNYKEDDNNNINNNTNIKTNNKILFQEEEDLKGTNAPNSTSGIRSNILNAENEEKKSDNEMINTQINTSTISFEKIMSEFAKYLFNNRIRFNSIFPSIKLDQIVNNQTISSETLKLGFHNASFPLSEKEFSVIMTHFDPINKSKVLVEELKHEISKYEPKYFTQSYQKIDSEEIDNKLMIKSLEIEKSPNFGKNVYNYNLLNGMNKIKKYLERKNIPINNFFNGLFDKKKNLDDLIDEQTWKNAFLIDENKKYIEIPELKYEELDAIFRGIDSKIKNEITLGDIINFFNDYFKKSEKLIDINDESSLNEYIKKELSNLFENYKDKERDTISLENFYICYKSINHKATKDEARNIVSQHTNTNRNEVVDKKVFEEIMFNQIQKELVIQKEEKKYISNLFKEADLDKNGFLKRGQIKYLIKNKIGCNLTDAELDEILDKVDIKQENEIDIIEFVYLLDNINSSQNNKILENNMNQNQELIPIMNLNLNLNMHRKIRPKDFVSLYSDLPLTFIPSFIREEQQKNNLLPSFCLKPLTQDDIIYEDIFPDESLIYQDKKEKNINTGIITDKNLKEFIPDINCKIYFDDYASGVSSPDESFFEKENSKFKVVGRLLKIALFDRRNSIFLGNAVSIDCIYKKEYQDRWYFEDDDNKFNNNIIIRYKGNDFKNIDVIFEFVLVIQKKIEQNIYTVEVSCGWCSIPLQSLQISRKEKLKINGGSPIKPASISEFDIRKKRTGFIPKLATLFEGPILSECPIRIKTFKDLNNDEKKNINYLPGLIICHSLAMNMISIYRKLLGKFILNHKDYLLKCIKDEYDLANMFCKIADVPDAFRVMNEIWKEIIIDGSSSAQKNDDNFLRANFEIYVQKINNILYAEKFKYNPLDPTELPRGDIKLMQDRDILLNSALRAGADKKFNKLEYKMDDYSYKPFTMDEINGQKGNSILEKFDEIITLSNI